jgi:hypothetical protein
MIWRDEWRLQMTPIMKNKEEKKEKHQHQLNIVVGGKEGGWISKAANLGLIR